MHKLTPGEERVLSDMNFVSYYSLILGIVLCLTHGVKLGS